MYRLLIGPTIVAVFPPAPEPTPAERAACSDLSAFVSLPLTPRRRRRRRRRSVMSIEHHCLCVEEPVDIVGQGFRGGKRCHEIAQVCIYIQSSLCFF